MIRVPSATEYAEMTFAEQARAVTRIRELLREYAFTEVEDQHAARMRLWAREGAW